MDVEILFPTINTDGGGFEYGKKLDDETYDRMIWEEFLRTKNGVERLVHKRDFASKHGTIIDYVFKKGTKDTSPDLNIELKKTTGTVHDSKNYEIDTDLLEVLGNNGKMFIMNMLINYDTTENDAESELRFWIDDSRKLLYDKDIPNDMVIKSLPKRHIFFVKDSNLYKLENCKIIKIFKKRFERDLSFNFSIIVEKLKIKHGE